MGKDRGRRAGLQVLGTVSSRRRGRIVGQAVIIQVASVLRMSLEAMLVVPQVLVGAGYSFGSASAR
jgi:hypothetical protein